MMIKFAEPMFNVIKRYLPEKWQAFLAQHVVGQQIAGVIEPELAHLGEHGALFGDLVFQDDVKRRNAVGGNHDQAVAIVVDLADLAFFDGFELSHNQTLHFSMFSAAQQRGTVLTLLFYHTAARFKRNRIKEKQAGFVSTYFNCMKYPPLQHLSISSFDLASNPFTPIL